MRLYPSMRFLALLGVCAALSSCTGANLIDYSTINDDQYDQGESVQFYKKRGDM